MTPDLNKDFPSFDHGLKQLYKEVSIARKCVYYVKFLTLFRRFVLYKKEDPMLLADNFPGVSIIKPLMGVDPLLEINLESHFQVNYPKVSSAC